MISETLSVTKEYKRKTFNAILAIVFFIVVYLLLILLAVGLTVLCGIGGYALMAFNFNFITMGFGVGVISMGILILIFLLKFIFKKNVIDRYCYIEITEQQEPQFYALIKEVAESVDTYIPEKIYLAPDVDAAVSYDSSFWSMFLPVKKKLLIGFGLVNTVSVGEFKAILAHELGHFSQRTMKIGSYVYNVNEIIHNMLYNDESYDLLAHRWGNVVGFFSFFVKMALKVTQAIQWILKHVYNIVNVSYLNLSREMEFQADEIAAHVAGSEPLVAFLLRFDLSMYSYNKVTEYYEHRFNNSIKTKNIYPQQMVVMLKQAVNAKLPLKNDLPQVSIEFVNRYNKSKLMIKDQWASHPTVTERIYKLRQLNIEKADVDDRLAFTLFRTPELWQERLTDFLFSTLPYAESATYIGDDEFTRDYMKEYNLHYFDHLFNGYYDVKIPKVLDIDQVILQKMDTNISIDTLYSNEIMDGVYTSLALENDIQVLEQIIRGDIEVKSFAYDGKRYTAVQVHKLVAELKKEQKEIQDKIIQNEKYIYLYFHTKALAQGKEDELKRLYLRLQEIDEDFNKKNMNYAQIIHATSFISETTPVDIIKQNLNLLSCFEAGFKHQINDILQNVIYQSKLSVETKELFTNYVSKEWVYFSQTYDDAAVQMLYQVCDEYKSVVTKTFIYAKKDLLNFMEYLEKTPLN